MLGKKKRKVLITACALASSESRALRCSAKGMSKHNWQDISELCSTDLFLQQTILAPPRVFVTLRWKKEIACSEV